MSAPTFGMVAVRVHAKIIREGVIHALPPGSDRMLLRGACAIASYVLSRALRDAGFEDAKLAGGEFRMGRQPGAGHCWVVVQDQIVDITASQFLVWNPVFVPTPRERKDHYREYWRGGRILARARVTHPREVQWMLTPGGADRIACAAYARHARESGDPSIRLNPRDVRRAS